MRPKVRNRQVQLAHAIVQVSGNRGIRTAGGERLQLEPDAKQPVDRMSVEFLSDALSFDRQRQWRPWASARFRSCGRHEAMLSSRP